MSDLLLSILSFAVAMTASPGPNNLMLTASGASFGFRRTVPHMLGIVIGFPVMVFAIGLGLGRVFEAFPVVHTGLKVVGTVYLVWLAWRIARAGRPDPTGKGRARPLSFLESAAFQWVNPKGWMMAVGAIATYTTVGGDLLSEVALLVGIFFLVAIPCTAGWALFGVGIGSLLTSPARLRAFNIGMALLLIASLVPVLLPGR